MDISTLGIVTLNPLIGRYHLAKGWVATSSVLDVCNILMDVSTGRLCCFYFVRRIFVIFIWMFPQCKALIQVETTVLDVYVFWTKLH